MHFHFPPVPVIALLLLAVLLPGCGPEEKQDLAPKVDGLEAEVEETRRKLSGAEKSLTSASDQLVLATLALDAAKKGIAEKDQALAQRDEQLRVAQAEIVALKKTDGFAFAEIRGLQQKGQSTVALGRYQQFVRDFPGSPLAADATSAIAALNAESQRDSRARQEIIDPKRPERELVKLFNEGYSSPQELALLFKGKTKAQVLALCGRPQQVFNDGTEIGYADKTTDPATSRKGMLIVGFSGDVVSTLRVDYAGRKIRP